MSIEPSLFLDGLLQYPPIAGFRHPPCACQVAFPATPCARRIGGGIAVQDDLRHLGPVRTFLVRVEQAQIGNV